MIEPHPYAPFEPDNATVLILGSFPGLEQTRKLNEEQEWFYSAKRNKFWRIIETVYDIPVTSVEDKKSIFERKGIAITDIVLSARRKKESNLDKFLDIVEYNTTAIQKIISNPLIKKVYFTSRFVENKFRKLFPEYTNCESLPSPSPRYARMTLDEKIRIYKEKLPVR